ncbi:MAG: metalloregulator ArsR/SmtB family transcription factor [Oscillospiraceae bacterium]
MTAKIHNHNERVCMVRESLPQDETLFNLADLFKLFGDTTRIKILYALSESELCVCAIAELLSMTQSAISHQLKALKDGKLVKGRREGKEMYYALADDHVRQIIDCGYEHIMEENANEKNI